jgi:hypothetical protein
MGLQMIFWGVVTSLVMLLLVVVVDAVAGLFFCRCVPATLSIFMATCVVCGRALSMSVGSVMPLAITRSPTIPLSPPHLTNLAHLLLLIQPIHLHALDDTFEYQPPSTRTTQCRIAGPSSGHQVLDACCHGSSVFLRRGVGIGRVDLAHARYEWEESHEEIPCRFSTGITTSFEGGGRAGMRTVKGDGDMDNRSKRCVV